MKHDLFKPLWLRRGCSLAQLTGLAACAIAFAQPVNPAAKPARSNTAFNPSATIVTLHDAIGPATADYFLRALARANAKHDALLIVEIDTPGGLDVAMRDMIQAILASQVPVVIYVAPPGARAASAGTYLLYASHIAAMAPATNLGAATPINIMPSSKPATPEEKPKDGTEGSAPEQSPDAMERKAVNDATAYIRSLAELRGRNVEWAEAAVRTAASLSADQALDQHVIDLIAKDIPDLLQQVDGRTVKIAGGQVTLHAKSLTLERVTVDWRTKVLAVITNPNVAYLLMLVGIYGLLLEGYHPGTLAPGITGAICLLLALFAFQVLSVNYAGLALIALGVLMIVSETFVPSFGALGIGGIVAFVLGSIMLMNSDVPGLQVAWQLIGSIALVAGSLLLALATFLIRVRRRPAVTGTDQLLGEPAYAIADFDNTGMVRVRGELWQAVTRAPIRAGQQVRIVKVRGLMLDIEPQDLNTQH